MHELTCKALGAAAVILDTAGQVLLVKHTYGMLNWELPGGAADRGESVTETALREVHEETGLRVRAERLTGVYYDPSNPLQEMVHFVFRCQPTDADAPRPSSPEVSACCFWPVDALPDPISDFTVRRISDALDTDRPLLPVTIGPRRWLP